MFVRPDLMLPLRPDKGYDVSAYAPVSLEQSALQGIDPHRYPALYHPQHHHGILAVAAIAGNWGTPSLFLSLPCVIFGTPFTPFLLNFPYNSNLFFTYVYRENTTEKV